MLHVGADVSAASNTLSIARFSFTVTNAVVKDLGPLPLKTLELVYCVLKDLCHSPSDRLTKYCSTNLTCKFQTFVSILDTLGFASAFSVTAQDMKVEKDNCEVICLLCLLHLLCLLLKFGYETYL